MNWADWTILTIIGISSLFSLKRGFVREALSLITWVSAFVVARLFSQSLSFLLEPYIQTPSVRLAAAFAILFIAALIVGALVNKLIGVLVEATGLSATDRILGIGFGAARGGLIIVAIVALIGMTPAINDQWFKESQLIPHFLLMEAWTKDVAGDVGRMIWNAGR
ncbi:MULTISPECIES: CvpA family protein [Neptuniibacter]|jgi:membrane protein required for colicin V production|uniref:CvpA family protein n=1 Tax=Neptuniibacter TaxID=459520 RepID=UPI0008305CEC|nr:MULTISPECIES: CvpA family protein [Neptuniibacter]MDO6513223.1 CvpA family protein [Neptuniibacter sp. 2_MG-2023]MDO6592365.1 CvpA family protein [Neptuniibacter sp. 1_MG-2023]